MPNILTLETNKYKVKVENFEGPLDLLCHLIDKNKMDICNIKISEITDQYIAYLNAMEELNLEIASEFLMMASTLLYLTTIPSIGYPFSLLYFFIFSISFSILLLP